MSTVSIRRATVAASLLVLSLVGFTGCTQSAGDTPPDDIGSRIYEQPVTLKDGRVVTCLVFIDFRKGGLACDFDHATAKTPVPTSSGAEDDAGAP